MTNSFSLRKSRRAIQWVGVIGGFLIGLRHIMPGESGSGAFDSFCPFGAVETLLPYILTGHTLKPSAAGCVHWEPRRISSPRGDED
jgi:hypothetical protein